MSLNKSFDEMLNNSNEETIDLESVLSEQALNALKEFYSENYTKNQNNDYIEENWQLSQFWYSEDTAHYLSDQVINVLKHNNDSSEDKLKTKSIACISCPTLFSHLYQKLSEVQNNSINLVLFEFDRRFETKYPLNFVFYDYNQPIDDSIKHKFNEFYFDVVIADPPFLSEECLKKVIQTIKYLTKDKILVCTGAVMRDLLYQCLQLKECEHFQPKHNRQLGNQFKCFSNFELNKIV